MRPFTKGESAYNVIKSVIPDFVESDYPLFVKFVTAFLQYLEAPRELTPAQIFTEYGNVTSIDVTSDLGGALYEARKLLEYRDIDQTIDEFTVHFLSTFAQHLPQYTNIAPNLLLQSLRQFYQRKGTTDTIKWLFRILFNTTADVYFPREDILRASDGTWIAPITLKVSSPLFGRPNADVAKFYIGQRVLTATGSGLVESVVTSIVGQAFNQNVIVNELRLRFDSITGTFAPGQELTNIDGPASDEVHTLILPVISGVLVNTGGSNYVVGDLVQFSEGPSGGGGYGAAGVVVQVSNTALNGVKVITGGDGYLVGLPVQFTSTSGSGASAVISEIKFGDFLLEDGTGYITVEEQEPAPLTNFLTLEDRNTLILELTIFPFVNSTATVLCNSTNYGVDTGVVQLNGIGFDSAISFALAAVNEKPFTHPWVFTNAPETTAELANASAILLLPALQFFTNVSQVFRITSPTDITTTFGTATITANVIVSDVTIGNSKDLLYLKSFVNFNQFDTQQYYKQNGTGAAQVGTLTTITGTANVSGNGTTFTQVIKANSHVRFGDGTHVAVKTVVNDTFFTAHTLLPVTLSANTWSVIPTGQVQELTFQAQRYFGKIKAVTLLSAGANYATPPAVSADSISARVQEKFYLDPNPVPYSPTSANNTVNASSGISAFIAASLQVQQDSGQITKVKVTSSGVNYVDANNITITALHGGGRTGSNAFLAPILGALTFYEGYWTTTRGFLSSDKFLQDATFYNDYTYVVRVAESFDRYRDILLKLLHPAGFRALGQYVSEQAADITVPIEAPVIFDYDDQYVKAVTYDLAKAYYRLGDRGYARQVLATSPKGYWKLDETAGTNALDSTGTANGTYTGGYTLNVAGALSNATKAVTLNGTNAYVTMGDVNAYEFSGAFSVGFWAKYTATQGLAAFVGKMSAALNSGWAVFEYSGTGSIQFYAVNGAGALLWDFHTTPQYNDNNYHFVVCQSDGTTNPSGLKIFVDNVMVQANTALGLTPGTGTTAFAIGSFGALVSGFFGGTVDEVAIWDRAISTAEIAALYAARVETDTVAAATAVNQITANNGTYANGVLLIANGAIQDSTLDKAASFPGKAYVSVPNHSAINGTFAAYSMEIWANTSTLSLPSAHRMMMSIGSGGQNYLSTSINGVGYPFASMKIGGVQKTANAGAAGMVVGTTYHIAATYDGANLKIYVNGVLGNTTPATGTVDVATGLNAIGDYVAGPVGTTWSWNGILDEAAVYQRALTAAEVLKHYNLRTQAAGTVL